MHDESNRPATISAATHMAAAFSFTTLSQLVLCLREDRQILKNPLSLGPRAPARGPRGAPPAVSSSSSLLPPSRFRCGLIYGPPCDDVHERAPSHIGLCAHGALRFLQIRKVPAGEGWGTSTSRGSVRVDYTGPWPSPLPTAKGPGLCGTSANTTKAKFAELSPARFQPQRLCSTTYPSPIPA
jgi:hypothetical protein